MIYGYIRVSSDKQTVENQRFEINKFCQREHLIVDGWIEEVISGTKSYDKRQLGRLLKLVKKGDLIICAELSRLGRNLFMIMEILNLCMTKECRVWTIKDNYRLGDDIHTEQGVGFCLRLVGRDRTYTYKPAHQGGSCPQESRRTHPRTP